MNSKMKVAAPSWLEIDIVGLRRTLERKGKAWAIFELVQNSWDTDATQVDVTLTKPNKNGMSTLTCRDNAPDGYRDLSEAHTLFGSSSKKSDPTKRGRFNAGEKFVLVMCESAKVTSTTGQILFQSNGTRKETDNRTNAGTEFQGVLEMTKQEWLEVGRHVQRLFPPIATTYNGVEITTRQPIHTFEETLPTEVANDRGVLTLRKRKTEVRIYRPQPGETPTIYERGIPVVEMDGKYHVSVEQKIPLNTERDNITPSYLKHIHLMVVNEMHHDFTEEDAAASWVPLADARLTPEAIEAIVTTRYGNNVVVEDPNDVGSRVEAAVHGTSVVPRGTLTRAEIKNVRDKLPNTDLLKKAGEVHPTNFRDTSKTIVPPEKYGDDLKRFVKLIQDVSPFLIPHKVVVKVIDDVNVHCLGCTHWEPDSYIFKINLAYHKLHNWQNNISLLIHEVAHHAAQNNNHGGRDFWQATTDLGAKLAQLALEQPDLFPEVEALEALAA